MARIWHLMSLLTAVVVGTLSIAACSKPSAPPGPSTQEYFEHTVKISGETLGIIAGWYTGAQSNWTVLRTEQGNGRIIRLGEKVYVPKNLMRRSAPLSPDYVAKFYARKEPSASVEGQSATSAAQEGGVQSDGTDAYGGATY